MDGVTLVIRVVDGRVQITGPIQDRVLCYGLLELAKDALRSAPQQPAGGLQLPTPGQVPGLLAHN